MSLPSSGWHKSTYSGDFEDACVEARVRPDGAGVLIRDSKDRCRLPLAVAAAAWHTFLADCARDEHGPLV
ncbi:DUF397 domain-containing protein [Streptomyces sp. NBC_01433]|uniref:DUF397 domain-containing protein n=1 Tax=Streptomyces sp. NBC_01433 TaxID=2903864 RepID=UPI0022557FA8|nr:DUF397 domain-containing protein [Streptomyces sp. NBC_01433]MCX4682557.1 DUF397 domain-containing protein [Streptomyces sp. NBC_01433]